MSYAGTILAFPDAIRKAQKTFFTRHELTLILDMYGRLVSSGCVRDYAILEGRGQVVFSFFRRSSERPAYMVVKDPAGRKRRMTYRVVSGDGQILKRGETLTAVLNFFEPKLLRLVKA